MLDSFLDLSTVVLMDMREGNVFSFHTQALTLHLQSIERFPCYQIIQAMQLWCGNVNAGPGIVLMLR